jgi:hypothetical protein
MDKDIEDTINGDTITISDSSGNIDLSDYSIDISSNMNSGYTFSQPSYGNVTINTSNTGLNGTWLTNNGSSIPVWSGNTTGIGSMGFSSLNSGLHVSSDAEFEGDIKWKGRSLGKLLEKIEDRLAILPDPDPKKLEKFTALKKAYDHYKMLERLIGDDDDSAK